MNDEMADPTAADDLDGALGFATGDDIEDLDKADRLYHGGAENSAEILRDRGFTVYTSDVYHTATERSVQAAAALVGPAKWLEEIDSKIIATKRGERKAALAWMREKQCSGESFFRVDRIDAHSPALPFVLNLHVYNGNSEAELAQFRVKSASIKARRLKQLGLIEEVKKVYLTDEAQRVGYAEMKARLLPSAPKFRKRRTAERIRRIVRYLMRRQWRPGHGRIISHDHFPFTSAGQFPSAVPGVHQRGRERETYFHDLHEFGRTRLRRPQPDWVPQSPHSHEIVGNIPIDPRERRREPIRIGRRPILCLWSAETLPVCAQAVPMWAQATSWRKSENAAHRNKFLRGDNPVALKMKAAVAKLLRPYINDEISVILSDLALGTCWLESSADGPILRYQDSTRGLRVPSRCASSDIEELANYRLRRKRPIGRQVRFDDVEIANAFSEADDTIIIAADRGPDERAKRLAVFRPCLTCGEGFTPKRSDAKYCSNACKQTAYYRKRRQSPNYVVTDNCFARVLIETPTPPLLNATIAAEGQSPFFEPAT